MARKRRFGFRRKARRAVARASSPFRRKRRGSRSSGGGVGNLTATIVGAAAYGAGREWASDKLQPVLSKIPAGDLADEVGMGVLSYFMAKGQVPLLNKVPYSREIGRAGLTIEAARVGSYVANRYLPTGTMQTTSTSW